VSVGHPSHSERFGPTPRMKRCAKRSVKSPVDSESSDYKLQFDISQNKNISLIRMKVESTLNS